jgi:RHS repeat-associated protein
LPRTARWKNHLIDTSYGNLKSQTPSAYSPFHRFTGKPFDTAVGLQYNINRWYDPATGRWISEDPIGFAGGRCESIIAEQILQGPAHEEIRLYAG